MGGGVIQVSSIKDKDEDDAAEHLGSSLTPNFVRALTCHSKGESLGTSDVLPRTAWEPFGRGVDNAAGCILRRELTGSLALRLPIVACLGFQLRCTLGSPRGCALGEGLNVTLKVLGELVKRKEYGGESSDSMQVEFSSIVNCSCRNPPDCLVR